MTGVRIRDDSFEGKCDYCLEFLPLTTEFWAKNHGLKRCRSCWAVYKRLRQRGYKVRKRDIVNAAQREKYAMMSQEERFRRAESQRRWKAANKEYVAAYNKAYRERHRAKINADARAYYAEARLVILTKKRARYASKAAAA